jgi:hypothetical protein
VKVPQHAQPRFIAAGGFFKLESEALRHRDDVGEEGFVSRARVLPTVGREEAGRRSLPDLLGSRSNAKSPAASGADRTRTPLSPAFGTPAFCAASPARASGG